MIPSIHPSGISLTNAMAPTLFFFLIFLQLICNCKCNAMKLPKFTALLLFGDSTVDTGNNNYLNTLAKGNHPPYGRDFPGHIATGRFSNGKLVPDMVASKLGIKDAIPPFLQPDLSDEELLTGVSFASGGAGLDDLTAAAAGVIPVSKQFSYLEMYVERLKRLVGEEEAQGIVNGALVVISAGTNDFALGFYDLPTRKLQFNINEYQDFLLNNLKNFVQKVYNMGCRKMVVAGLPPIGCLPIQMTLKAGVQRTCLHYQNSDSKVYNQKLAEDLIPRWTRSLPGSLIIYADVYNPLSDMINRPQKYGNFDIFPCSEDAVKVKFCVMGFINRGYILASEPYIIYGFRETGMGCCGTGLVEVGPFCSPLSLVCPNASLFLFWDSVHPTESAYCYLAQTILKQIIGSIPHRDEPALMISVNDSL